MQDDAEHTLKHGFAKLKFGKELELRFLNDLRTSRSAGTPSTTLFIGLFANILLLADWLMIPDVLFQAVILRLGLITPISFVLGFWSFNSLNMRVRERILWFIDTLIATVHAWLCLQSESEYSQEYLIALSLFIVYSASHLRTRFWIASKSISGIFIIYCISLFFVQENSWPVNISILILLGATGIFSLYNMYALEYEARLNFLMMLRHKKMHEELIKTNATLEKVARVDPLTQVANRMYFEQYLDGTWERAKRQHGAVIVMMLDVDFFKNYNDHFGHPKGDACLIDVSQAILKSLRRPGDLVARYGGEEFVVVLNNSTDQDAKNAAERICDVVRSLKIPHPASLVSPYVTISVGMASMRASEEGASPQCLIALADNALYRAKNEGRDRVCIHKPS